MQPFHAVSSIDSTSHQLREHDLSCGLCLLDWHVPAIFHLVCPKNTQRHSLRHRRVHQPAKSCDFCGFAISPSRWISWKEHNETENTYFQLDHDSFDLMQCQGTRHFPRSAFSFHPCRGSKCFLCENWTPPLSPRPLSESGPGDELEVRTKNIVVHYLSTLWQQKLPIDHPVWALYSQQLSCKDLMACFLYYSIATHESEQRLYIYGLGWSDHHRYRRTAGYRWLDIVSEIAHRHFLTQDLVRAGLHHADSLRTGRPAGRLRCRRSLDESRKNRPWRAAQSVKTSGLVNSAWQFQRSRKQREQGLMRDAG